jgi:hypothetical protein
VRDPALEAWGDYDRDNPFPLFARVRAAGPVHQVTLPDGQRAWLVARHAQARAALNDPRLSKDMHAALARDGAVVAEGLPGPAFARHMLSVDPPDHTRLRTLAAAATAATWPSGTASTTASAPGWPGWRAAVKLRRFISAARFRGPCPEQATPQETRAVLAAWAAAGT